jgi:hypothetical protein
MAVMRGGCDAQRPAVRSMPIRSSIKSGGQTPEPASGALPVDAPALKPYLSIAELAQLTPWTDQAIRTTISRGVFQEGQHFFYVGGVRSSNGPRSSASLNRDRRTTECRIAAIR